MTRQCFLFNVGRVKRSVPVRSVAPLTGMSLRSFTRPTSPLPVLHCYVDINDPV